MARTTSPAPDPTRKAAFASGVSYLVTFAASIPAALLLAPILTDPRYVLGAGPDTQVLVACLLDLVNVIACIASAVAVFTVLRRHHESLALGFVATRLLEGAVIVPGICALLAVVSMRQAGLAGADEATLVAVSRGLVGFRDWTFVLGPGLVAGLNALMFATALYRARLVPRWIPALGLVGAPLLLSSVAGVVLGVNHLGSTWSVVALAPIFVWELSVGLRMTFKGFDRDATWAAPGATPTIDRREVATPPTATTDGLAAAAPWAAPVRFASGFRPRRRHLLLVAGLYLAIVGNAEAARQGVGIAAVILVSAIPSLPLLLGIGRPTVRGRVASRVVRPLNASREPLLPLALFALGTAAALPVTQAAALVWLGSIVIAWGLGDGLRHADGSRRDGVGRMTSLPLPTGSRGAAAAA